MNIPGLTTIIQSLQNLDSSLSGTLSTESEPNASTKWLAPLTTVSTSPPYTAGDSLYTPFSLAVRSGAGAVILKSISITDFDQQNQPLTMFFLRAAQTGTYTINGALSPSSADATNCDGLIKIVAGDYTNFGNNYSIAQLDNIGLELYTSDGNIYVVAKTDGTPNYTVASSMRPKFKFL